MVSAVGTMGDATAEPVNDIVPTADIKPANVPYPNGKVGCPLDIFLVLSTAICFKKLYEAYLIIFPVMGLEISEES